MTMTLGFGAHDYLARSVGEDGVNELLIALGKHAPDGKPIRIGSWAAEAYNVLECGPDGVVGVPADLAVVQAAIKKAGFASWANDDAPEGLQTLILPGTGWNDEALRDEPAIQMLFDNNAFIVDLQDTKQARIFVDAQGKRILAVADKHRLLCVFR